MDTKTGIEQAIDVAGGQVKLAEALGVTQQAVSIWLQRGFAPLKRIVEIETLFGVPRSRLINPRFADLVDLPTEGGDE
jgi:hypothetical protein